MRLLIIAAATLIFTGNIFSQEEIWTQWDQEIIEQANTAKDIGYYNEQEKQIVQLMNLARMDGILFSSTFLSYYIRSTGMPKNNYVNSLFKKLKSVSNLPLLMPKKDLSDIAKGHATVSGKSGHVGHKNMQKRFEPVFGTVYFHMAENCSYGYEAAMDIVITLLIDDGIKSLGHRKNILNINHNSTGVSIQPHKDYRTNCVIDFGGDSY